MADLIVDGEVLKLSASQVKDLAACEEAWRRKRETPRVDQAPKDRPIYFILGDLLHDCRQAHGVGRDWRPLLDEYAISVGWDPDDEWDQPEWVVLAGQIMEAYERLFGPPAHVLMAVEYPFDLEVPGRPGARVRGALDGLRRLPAADGNTMHDTFRVAEYKSMARWGRDAYVEWAFDTHLYLWAAHETVPRITGLDFEAMSTYDYKPTEPSNPDDPESVAKAQRKDDLKRFRTVRVEWEQEAADHFIADLQRYVDRARAILEDPSVALKARGEECKRCPFKDDCLRPWDEWVRL